MEIKTEKAKELFNNGDKIKALKIVAKFRRLGQYKDKIQLANDCINHKDFYLQIGKNVDKEIEIGLKALEKFLFN